MAFVDLTAALRLNIDQFKVAMDTARKQTTDFAKQMSTVGKKNAIGALAEGYTKLDVKLRHLGVPIENIVKLFGTKMPNAVKEARKQLNNFYSFMGKQSKQGSADKLIEGYERLQDRLHKVGFAARDVARIFAGITISQTFYTVSRAIREATQALWDFNEGLDYAQVTYGALFGDSTLASNFIDTMKQFSIDTIFEYTDIENMARKLSAYGIEYQNLMYIIEGLTNIGTISGDTAALERLAVAIGQINAKGTLKAEELRQLANAYTPIYDILRDKLGLSEEDLGMVGDLGISSADAINAIIEYANETFGATADAAVLTIRGLNNRIVDSLKVMGADMMSPITTFYKSLAKFISDGLNDIYQIYQESGIGGVFEHLIPSEEWQQRIRSLVAALSNAVAMLASLVTTLWPSIKQFLGGAIDAFTIFLGVINTAVSGFIGFIQSVDEHTPILRVLTSALVAAAGAWILFRLHALAAAAIAGLKAIFVGVAQSVVMLTAALTKSPLIVGLILLGAVMLGVSSNANNANSAISNLINSLNSFSVGGNTADDMLQLNDAMKDGATAGDEFWNSMEEGAGNAGDEIENAGDAAKKAARNLLSFDEVFRLNEEEDTAGLGEGSLDGIKDLAGALSGLGAALVPTIPDLSSFADEFVSTLYDDLWKSIQSIASGGATGAIIGGLVGFALGGFITKTMKGALAGASLGTKIGGIAGAAFAGFWTDAYEELEGSLAKIAGGGATGALAGALAGLVIGAFATKTVDGAIAGAQNGARLGGMLGMGLGAFWASATEEMSNTIEGLIVGSGAGAITGALVGFLLGAFSTKTLKGAVAGAGLGAKIGTAAGALIGGIFGSFEEDLQKAIESIAISASMGMLLGGVAGMLIGAFATKNIKGAMAGAKIGAGLGGALGGALDAIFGDFEETLTEKLEGMFSSVTAAGYGALFGGIVGMIVGAIVGAFAAGVGVIPLAKAGASLGASIGMLGGIVYSYLKDAGIIEAIGDWFDEIFTAIGNWLESAGKALSSWWSDLKSDVNNWFSNLWSDISTWWTNLVDDIGGWFVSLGASIKNWWNKLWTGFVSGWTHVKKWFTDVGTSIGNWFTELGKNIKTLWNALWDPKVWKSGWSSIKGWFTDLFSDIKGWFSSLGDSVSNWWTELWGNNSSPTVYTSPTSRTTSATRLGGHATGGIFNREHIARFAEGNKAEAVIPLENASAMQPFVTAISDGILQGILPALATGSNANSLPPMYVGTLVADERGLQQLFKKFELYEAKELARKGMA